MQLSKKLLHTFLPAALGAMALPVQAQRAVQVTAGQSAYVQNCAGCHGSNLDDGQFAPPVKGTAFTAQWGGKSVGDLFSLHQHQDAAQQRGRTGRSNVS